MDRIQEAYQKQITKNKCMCGECDICDFWYQQAVISEMGEFSNLMLDKGIIDLQESIDVLNSAA